MVYTDIYNSVQIRLGVRSCVVCRSRSFRRRFNVNGIRILACNNCGLTFADIDKEKHLNNFYEYTYFNNIEGNSIGYRDYTTTLEADRYNHYRIFKLIQFHCHRCFKLMDVGCAHGVLVKFAKEMGINAKGIDPSAYAIEYGRKIYNVNIERGCIEDHKFSKNDKYDAVTMIGVLEHLAQPSNGLKNINKLLRPGGVLLLTTLNAGRYIHLFKYKPPEHIYYFNYPQLKEILKRSGFKIIEHKLYFRSYFFSVFMRQAFSVVFPPMIRYVDMLFKQAPQLDFIARFPTNEIMIVAKKVIDTP